MDGSRFDQLTRGLGRGGSRRGFLRGLLGLGGAAATGAGLRASDADAARRPTPTPKPVTCARPKVLSGNQCVCPGGTSTCGPDCCPDGQAECCDNACCYGECLGEELCCPAGQVVCNGNCCEPGEQCVEGICQQCTPCGNQCCGGSTPTCCQDSVGSTCAASEESCCTNDLDCTYLSRCEGDILIQGYCWLGVCQTAPQDCDQGDACYTFSCVDSDGPTCLGEPIPGCCTQDSQCQAADTCTPGRCLDNHTCNALTSCGSGEVCCSGTCVAGSACCVEDADCRSLNRCDDLELHRFTCTSGSCLESIENCAVDDPCIRGECQASRGRCARSTTINCCRSDADCTAADDCTPAFCLENNTCSFDSICTDPEVCCADGLCSEDGTCNRGCTIEGVEFSPCKRGCPTCVAPDGGTVCGCGRDTGVRCESTDFCKELYAAAICAGTPGLSTCIEPSLPVI